MTGELYFAETPICPLCGNELNVGTPEVEFDHTFDHRCETCNILLDVEMRRITYYSVNEKQDTDTITEQSEV